VTYVVFFIFIFSNDLNVVILSTRFSCRIRRNAGPLWPQRQAFVVIARCVYGKMSSFFISFRVTSDGLEWRCLDPSAG